MRTLLSLLILITVSIAGVQAAPPPASRAADATVELTGWLHVEDLTMKDVVLEVEVNGTVRTAPVSESGKFNIDLPADAAVTLRFEKPGHVTKEVTVDTRNVQDGSFTKEKKRHVKFAVIMELERFMAGLTYVGPVGDIAFEQGGGCVSVAHTRQVEPVRKADMEF
ncbi:MAG: hypothetical protein JNM62_07715 [Flavobacteriales bacterium]|nr:hypothetical protein [Flavobacteriales bacterium]